MASMQSRVNRRRGTKTAQAQLDRRRAYRAQVERRKNKTKGA